MAFQEVTGTLIGINDLGTGMTEQAGCYKLLSLDTGGGMIVNFTADSDTCIVDHAALAAGDQVSMFYDMNAPVPLIYPPQYRAVVISRQKSGRFTEVDFFDSRLISSSHTLKLNIGPDTKITLPNGLLFTASLTNRVLAVVYGASTRSIPAQTTPFQIIVLCL